MNTYSITSDGQNGFQVTVTGPSGKGGNITTGFHSESAAQAFVDNCRQIEASAAQMPASFRPV